MTRPLLGLILLLATAAANAEWAMSNNDEKLTQYVDRATLRRSGNMVKMWDLVDHKTIQRSSAFYFLSSKWQYEYDCKEERRRALAFIWFDGKMGNGKVVYSNRDSGKWGPISPGSVGETLWKIACNASNINKMNIKKAVDKIRGEQKNNGMVGAVAEIDACYMALENLKASSSSKYMKFEYCVSMDLTALRIDSIVSKKLNFPPHEYFEEANVVRRFHNKIAEGFVDKDRLSEIRGLVDEYIMNSGR